jgi:fatty acid desaturase
LLVHHVDIEDEFDESPDRFGKLALLEFFLFVAIIALLFLFCVVFIFVLVVQLNLSVVAFVIFIMILRVVLAYRTGYWYRGRAPNTSRHSYSAPASKEVTVLWIFGILEDLKDVEFVIVVLD